MEEAEWCEGAPRCHIGASEARVDSAVLEVNDRRRTCNWPDDDDDEKRKQGHDSRVEDGEDEEKRETEKSE